MQTEPNAKQQIAQAIKNSTNILVTVGRNPSVDSLSAALGLTLMLNRLEKHATAVFSGEIPPAITFLEPGKTFENTVDSLRDFIIALDKEKADRLRYKVEDDVVRIFITPYRTVISEKDLKFSQGDFNVELIVALGVEKREDLDAAITAHGRILHDATVVTINADGGQSTLGSTDWSDPSASSLSEMLMSLSESLQSGLLDQQISTAVLTGIVAATDRFRNEHTSPKVMTMAAQLMAAGANQQLIASKLEEAQAVPVEQADSRDGTTPLSEGSSQKVKQKKKKKSDGSLEIKHQPKSDAAPVKDPSTEALEKAEAELSEQLETTAPIAAAPTLSVNDLKTDLEAAAKEVEVAAEAPVVPESPQIIKQERRKWQTEPGGKPTFGGTLNATASDAEEAKRAEEQEHRNEQLLQHDSAASNVVVEPESEPTDDISTFDVPSPVSKPVEPVLPPELPEPMSVEPPTPPQPKPLESTSDDVLNFEATPLAQTGEAKEEEQPDADQASDKAAEDARAAIDAALSGMPFDPAGKPAQSAGATPVFEINHEHTDPLPTPPQPVTPQAFTTTNEQPVQPAAPSPAIPPMPASLPPLPDFSTLPPLPTDATAPLQAPVQSTPAPSEQPGVPQQSVPQASPVPQAPADPGQFKIPGQ